MMATGNVEIAVLDRDGVIVSVNDAWLRYASLHGGDPATTGVGSSYLEVCEKASDDPGAAQVAAAVRAAIAGRASIPLSVVFDCGIDGGTEEFDILVWSRWADDGRCAGAVVALTPVPQPTTPKPPVAAEPQASGARSSPIAVTERLGELRLANRALRTDRDQTSAIAEVVRSLLLDREDRSVIVRAAHRLSGGCEVSLLESADGILVVTADTCPDRVGTPLPSELHGEVTRAIRRGRATWSGPRAALPILRGEDPLGALLLIASDGVRLKDHRGVLELLAAETALALHHARLVAELERQSTVDPLTGAVNRRAWDSALHRELPRAVRTARPLTILMIDLDHFKSYNDAYGHAAGDTVLRLTAQAWRDRLRPSDLLCRWGGDEFAVMLPGCDLNGARRVASDLQHLLRREGMTCSVGGAQWDGAEPLDALLTRADVQLYTAKAQGRDRMAADPR